MRRASILAIGLSGGALTLALACENKQAPCESDGDCPVGQICRAGICGEPGALDNDASVDVLVTPPACFSAGASCNNDSECCSPPCTSFRCAGTGSSGRPPGTSSGTSGTSGASSGTTSSGGACSDLYGICASDFDCCTGLRCQSGTCR